MDSQTNEPTELERLKTKAGVIGVSHSPNIGVDALRAKIKEKLEGEPVDDEKAEEVKTGKETTQQTRKRLQKSQLALVRCRVYNLNPTKRDLEGEIVTVGNKFLGTVRKYIPFGEATEGGYHIEQILLTELLNRKFQDVRTKKNKGQIDVKTRMVPEYNIEVLPPLTDEELKELAEVQAAAERVGV
jgi:hypothetical protein